MRAKTCPWNAKTCTCARENFKWSPRVFEIRARKRMSLGEMDLLLMLPQEMVTSSV